MYWGAAPAVPGADWRSDPRIAAIVAAVAPRDVALSDAQGKLSTFADGVATADRPAVLAETFSGLVDATNQERSQLIARIEGLARRQRDLTHIVTQLTSEVRDAPPGTPEAADLIERRDFATRAFQEAQRTMRYACEAPASMDIRLGEFSRILQGRLSN